VLRLGAVPRGPAEGAGRGPGLGATPFCRGAGVAAIFTCDGRAGVYTGTGVVIATMGAAVAGIAVGCGIGVAAGAVGADVGRGRGAGARVGGTRIEAATLATLGTAVGTLSGIGAEETAITGAGVGFGGAVGANFASS